MDINIEDAVGRIALEHPAAIEVFEKYGIDFCCRGEVSLEAACRDKEAPVAEVLAALKALPEQEGKAAASADVADWPLDLLADYIEKTHHRYVEAQLPLLTAYLEKIVAVHGEAHPELKQIKELFQESAGEFTKHMKKEELILFPFIRKLVQMQLKGGEGGGKAFAGTVQHPIRMMIHDHDAEGERFRRIALLSNGYNPPADACTTYQATYLKLKEFEKDLHQHIHLENNLLFPGAIALETQLSHE